MTYKDRLLIKRQYRAKERTGGLGDPYFGGIHWRVYMSPIEWELWDDIRSWGIRLYPQYPVLRYFADFANPDEKVVVEVDGKEWHDPEADAVRDKEMQKAGWHVYRFDGASTLRTMSEEQVDGYQTIETEAGLALTDIATRHSLWWSDYVSKREPKHIGEIMGVINT